MLTILSGTNRSGSTTLQIAKMAEIYLRRQLSQVKDFGLRSHNTTGTEPVWLNDINMQVSTVPVPAAVWLFGTALVGLIGFSNRRRAA
jgi:hypothetical protein